MANMNHVITKWWITESCPYIESHDVLYCFREKKNNINFYLLSSFDRITIKVQKWVKLSIK